jgi:hypothetical protein
MRLSLTKPVAARALLAAVLNFKLRDGPLHLTLTGLTAVFAAGLFISLELILTGNQAHHFGDFYALWSSGELAQSGAAVLNYDADALHLHQVALGMNPDQYNPFPYPPMFLALLAPLGRFSLGWAFALLMVPTFALYLLAMAGGRVRDWLWWVAACLAPASTVVWMSGQTGFLSGALMVGGLRLAPSRPIFAGVLFGLLCYKPQLGVLVPVALIAAGSWRAIAAAMATVAVCALASSEKFGWEIWPAWFASIVEYAGRFHPVIPFMPTIYANALMLGFSARFALAAQILVAIPVAALIWRAFRNGFTPRASALLIVGTFLATPHAFNYDMPMMTAAIAWYFEVRYRATRGLSVGEALILTLALILPFAMVTLRNTGIPVSWAPELLLFWLIAKPRPALEALASSGVDLREDALTRFVVGRSGVTQNASTA